jgi:hypothetical protein
VLLMDWEDRFVGVGVATRQDIAARRERSSELAAAVVGRNSKLRVEGSRCGRRVVASHLQPAGREGKRLARVSVAVGEAWRGGI